MRAPIRHLLALAWLLPLSASAGTVLLDHGEGRVWPQRLLIQYEATEGSPAAFAAPANPADPAALADQHLDRYRTQLFGSRAAARPALRRERVRRSLSGHQVFHRQLHRGVPVEDSSVIVQMDRRGRLLAIWNDARPGLELVDVDPSISGVAAISVVVEPLGADRIPQRAPSAELVVLAEAKGRLAYRVEAPFFTPYVDLVAHVDAETGKLIRSVDRMIHEAPVEPGFSVSPPPADPIITRSATKKAEGVGMVLPANPLNGEPSRYALRDGNPVIDDYRESKTLFRLDGSGLLRGEYVDVTNGDQPRAQDNGLEFNYSSLVEDGPFHEVNSYWHVDVFQHYLKDTLGIDGANDHAQAIFVHGREDDQSSYSSGGDIIDLGDGGVDDSEDGEIVLHEYGHALHDHISPINVANHENAALSEGFGDYIAASFGDNPLVGEWDATSYNPGPPPMLRSTATAKIYPRDMSNLSVHSDGEIISAAWWDLRDVVGAETADRLIIESMFLFSSNGGFRQFADATLLADRAIFGGINYDAIYDAYNDRGIRTTITNSVLILNHTPLSDTQEKGPFTVSASLSTALTMDADEPMQLFHRLEGDTEYSAVSMTSSDGGALWTAPIPDPGLDTDYSVDYYIVALAENGTSARAPDVAAFSFSVTLTVIPPVPTEMLLGQNFPNPFNPTTNIEFTLPKDGNASLRIYDSAGRVVRTLFDEFRPAGPNTPVDVWDGTDQAGQAVGSGVYYYRLVQGSVERSRRMLLVR